MRKSNTQKLQEVLNESLKELNIDNKIKQLRILKSWEELVGKTIAKYTKGLHINKKKLFVTLDSSVVRNELYMIKDGLLQKLNEIAGEDLIEDIIFK
ncbi:DUF721 domain-containing protein [Bacteroidota bacterium]